jgi:hypothetical protein
MGLGSFIKRGVSAHHFIRFSDRRAENNTLGKAAPMPPKIRRPERFAPPSKACSGIVRLCLDRMQIRKSAWPFVSGHGIVAHLMRQTRCNFG